MAPCQPTVQCTVIFFIWVYTGNVTMLWWNSMWYFCFCLFSLYLLHTVNEKREGHRRESTSDGLNNSASLHESHCTFHTLSTCKVCSLGKAHDYFITSVTHRSEILIFLIYFGSRFRKRCSGFCDMFLHNDKQDTLVPVPNFFWLVTLE